MLTSQTVMTRGETRAPNDDDVVGIFAFACRNTVYVLPVCQRVETKNIKRASASAASTTSAGESSEDVQTVPLASQPQVHTVTTKRHYFASLWRELDGHTNRVTTVVLTRSRHGELLCVTASIDKTLKCYAVESGMTLRTLPSSHSKVETLSLSVPLLRLNLRPS